MKHILIVGAILSLLITGCASNPKIAAARIVNAENKTMIASAPAAAKARKCKLTSSAKEQQPSFSALLAAPEEWSTINIDGVPTRVRVMRDPIFGCVGRGD